MKKGTLEAIPANRENLKSGSYILDIFSQINEVIEVGEGSEGGSIYVKGISPNGDYYVPRYVNVTDTKILAMVETFYEEQEIKGTTEEAVEKEMVETKAYYPLDNEYWNLAVAYYLNAQLEFEADSDNIARIGNKAQNKEKAIQLIERLTDAQILRLTADFEHYEKLKSIG